MFLCRFYAWIVTFMACRPAAMPCMRQASKLPCATLNLACDGLSSRCVPTPSCRIYTPGSPPSQSPLVCRSTGGLQRRGVDEAAAPPLACRNVGRHQG